MPELLCVSIALHQLGMSVVTSDDAEIVLHHAVFSTHRQADRSNHLTEIEGLIHHIMVEDVGGAEIEAEQLQWPQNGVIENLILQSQM